MNKNKNFINKDDNHSYRSFKNLDKSQFYKQDDVYFDDSNNKNTKTKEQMLIEKLKEYIILLGKDAHSMVGLAYVHGWRSQLFEEGIQLRKEIEELENKINS